MGEILTAIITWMSASGGWTIIALIIGIAMATSAIGAIVKTFLKKTSVSDSNRRLILNVLNVIIGSVMGFFCFDWSVATRMLVGLCAGYYSSVFYRVMLKQLYNRCGINEKDLEKDYDDLS